MDSRTVKCTSLKEKAVSSVNNAIIPITTAQSLLDIFSIIESGLFCWSSSAKIDVLALLNWCISNARVDLLTLLNWLIRDRTTSFALLMYCFSLLWQCFYLINGEFSLSVRDKNLCFFWLYVQVPIWFLTSSSSSSSASHSSFWSWLWVKRSDVGASGSGTMSVPVWVG